MSNVLNDDGSMYMFWIDAYEKNGVVYLFGKVFSKSTGVYTSCCVVVNGIERNLFVLPRQKVFDGKLYSFYC